MTFSEHEEDRNRSPQSHDESIDTGLDDCTDFSDQKKLNIVMRPSDLGKELLDDEDKESQEQGNDDDAYSDKESSENELFGLENDSSTKDILMVLTKQAIPVVISFFLSISGTFINLIFAGHYSVGGDGSVIFAGVSLANMFANVSCLSLLIGMSSAVETLGSQHNGAGRYEQVGLILQRSCCVLGVMTIPIGILWLFTANIFASLGVEPAVCDVIRQFITVRALTIPIDVFNESFEKYLMSIGVMNPAMWSNIAFNICIFSFNCIFVYWLKLPYVCLAWSWVLSTYLSVCVVVALSWNHPSVRRTMLPPDRRALTEGWQEFITLGLPGTVMLCSEWWAFEILTIFASILGTAQVAAQTIIMQVASLSFMIPLGVGIAAASLVGNAIGAGRVHLAISIGRLSIYSILIVGVVVGLAIWSMGQYMVAWFTSDSDVYEHARSALPFLSLFILIDGLQASCSGVLRGAGKQAIGAVANVIAFYGIGLPMAWCLCFTFLLGVNGLIMGIAFGTAFQVTVLLIIIFVFEGYLYSPEATMISELNQVWSSLMTTAAGGEKGGSRDGGSSGVSSRNNNSWARLGQGGGSGGGGAGLNKGRDDAARGMFQRVASSDDADMEEGVVVRGAPVVMSPIAQNSGSTSGSSVGSGNARSGGGDRWAPVSVEMTTK